MTKHCTKPCENCPFSRNVQPGYLGGGSPLSFIGQAHGPFLLPCHMQKGYDPKTADLGSVQCGGAAIFRANVGVADRMPSAMHHLPADRESVFATEAEFLAHHTGGSLEAAQDFLSHFTPTDLMRQEMAKQAVRNLDTTKE